MFRFGQDGVSRIVVLAALFVITACGGSGGGSGGGSLTVSGIVVDFHSTVVNGANIMLNHDPASLVITGTAGTFSFANVTPPYTLTLKAGTTVLEYRDLSRANPQLSTSGAGAIYSATLAGTIASPALPLPAGQFIIMGAKNGVLSNDAANNGTGAYNALFLWSGSPVKTTDLAALHLSFIPNGLITSYWQTGTLTGVSLHNGVNQTSLNFALSSAVNTANTILNYNPGAYAVGANGSYLILKANGAQYLIGGLTIPSGTNVLLPSGGATLLVSGQDAGGNSATRIGTAVLGGTTTLNLPVNTVLKNSLPAINAINVSKTPTLSWTPVSDAEFYLVEILGGGKSYFIYLPGSSATLTIPDYTALGLPLAGSTPYTWDVFAFESSGMSVDYVTDPATGAFFTINTYEASSLNRYNSASTTFTTAP